MSKVVVSLPKDDIRRGVVGGLLALVCYTLLQFVCALLVHREILGGEQVYPAVCVCAAVSSFLGCGYSVLKGKGSIMLPVSSVAAVFLILTLLIALLAVDSISVERGLVGVGLSMAAGALASALVGDGLLKHSRNRRRRQPPGRGRRTTEFVKR